MGCGAPRRGTMPSVAPAVHIWTWDIGSRLVDMDGPPGLLLPILETVLQGGLWDELLKFPPDTVARLLPHLKIYPQTRRLLELWIEEAPHRAA